MKDQQSIDVLNTLIQINNDRIEGYETASKETKETDLKNLFFRLAQTSERCKRELVYEVRKLGGTPVEGTTTSGKFFRIWMDMKAALTGNDRKAILSSCEYGEDAAVDTYNSALSDGLEYLTTEQQSMIIKQLMLINVDHDKVKELRDMLVEHAR